MVFEKFAVQLLDKYLSDYIENLDYKKLKIDMWSGRLNLNNMKKNLFFRQCDTRKSFSKIQCSRKFDFVILK